ncbi:MAG: ABC transporter ATP-binding protein [Desulfobacteraceae bacterium]|jgi:ATP-binding cassette subfamily B protein
MIDQKTTRKIAEILKIHKAVALVWRASPMTAVLNLLLLVILSLLPLVSLYLMKMIVDSAAVAVSSHGNGNSYRHVIMLVLLAGVAALMTAVAQQVSKFIKDIQTITVTDYVYDVLHEKSIAIDLSFYENPTFFDSLHRAQKEGPYRPTRIVNGLTSVFQNGISLVALAGLLISFHWGLACVLFVSTLPGILVKFLFSRDMYKWQKRRTRTEREASYYNSMMTGEAHAKEIRLFGLGDLFVDRFRNLRRIIREEKIALSKRRILWDLFAQSAAVLAVFGSLAYIVKQCVDGHISLGDLVLFFQAFQKALSCLKDFFESLAGLYEDNLFLTHFYSFLDIEPKVEEPENPVVSERFFEKSLCFDHVNFKYPHSDRKALLDVSFDVKPGEVIALVGENGSGKTTLIKLLCRLYDPKDGSIRFDGTDIRHFRSSDLRKKISVVFQDYIKYQLTVKENIWLGQVERPLDDADVIKAARFANAHDMIENLPNSYDTLLGKWMADGEELSIGQWQKIALARAFFGESQIVVLDEPTSALDPESEYQVFLTFRKLLENKTAFLISHRFSTVKMADRILVLAEGRIIESGTHDELMEKNGTYHRMFTMQALNYQN